MPRLGHASSLRRARVLVAGGALVLVVTSLAVASAASAGDPDLTFGEQGSVLVGFESAASGATRDTARGLVVDPAGRIVVAGTVVVATTTTGTVLAGLRSDGSLDPEFGDSGRLYVGLGSGIATSSVAGIGRQSSGRLVVAGTYTTSTRRFGLLGFLPDGGRDESFGADGGVLHDAAAVRGETLEAIEIQSDDRIVVAGHGCDDELAPGLCRSMFVVGRFTKDGARDTTFGSGDSNGIVARDLFPAGEEEAYAVAVQPNGRVVAAGAAKIYGSTRMALARYRTNGTLDPTFSGDGKLLMDFATSAQEYAYANAVAVQPDGKIVVAGTANMGTESEPRWRIALARYRPDGTLDPGFDGDGKVTTGYGPLHLRATALVVQPNGRIVVAGRAQSRDGSVERLTLVRYRADGKLDPSFSQDGRVLRTGPKARATDVALQADGSIVTVGAAELRYNAAGLQTDFLITRHQG